MFLFEEDDIKNFILKMLFSIVLILVLIIALQVIKKIIKPLVNKNLILKNVLNEGKRETLNSLFDSIILFLSIILGIISLVYIWLGPVSLGLATILGVAAGVSLQNFIKDIISGLLIIIEDQFKVGDFIEIENKQGTVTKLTLRSTEFKDPNGSIHIIPNSLITKLTNFSKGHGRILVEIIISNKNNINTVMMILNEFCMIYENPDLITRPTVHFSSVKETSMLIKVIAFSNFTKFREIEEELRIKIIKLLDEFGVKFA